MLNITSPFNFDNCSQCRAQKRPQNLYSLQMFLNVNESIQKYFKISILGYNHKKNHTNYPKKVWCLLKSISYLLTRSTNHILCKSRNKKWWKKEKFTASDNERQTNVYWFLLFSWLKHNLKKLAIKWPFSSTVFLF